MKKLISVIIFFILWISSVNAISFNESLELNIGPEIYDINQYVLDDYNFTNTAIENTYSDVKKIDKAFRKQIFTEFTEWKIKRYEVNWIVNEYENFTYYANKFFYFLDMADRWMKDPEISHFIGTTYKNLNASYQRLNMIVLK